MKDLSYYSKYKHLTYVQVWIKLDNEDTKNTLHIVPETYGMDVPSACTIVIIVGNVDSRCFKKIFDKYTQFMLR